MKLSSSKYCLALKKNKGFTLVEMIAIVTIALIIAQFTIANVVPLLNRRAINQTAQTISDSLSLALKTAQKRADTTLICTKFSATKCLAGHWNTGWSLLGIDRNVNTLQLQLLHFYKGSNNRIKIITTIESLVASREGFFDLAGEPTIVICDPEQLDYWVEIQVTSTQILKNEHFFSGQRTTCTV